MESNYNLIDFTTKEKEYIESLLMGFCKDFDKGITIYKRVGRCFNSDITYRVYIGTSENVVETSDYVCLVMNLDELNGWFFGMIQANRGLIESFGGIKNEK